MSRPTRTLSLSLLAVLALASCRQDMHDQPRHEPMEASDLFADGRASRPQQPGTVARGALDRQAPGDGLVDGQPLTAFPYALLGLAEPAKNASEAQIAARRRFLQRGRERYGVACAPCHGLDGGGRGIIVRRGFPQPPSLHIDRLRDAAPGYLVQVIAGGFGRMPAQGDKLKARDRWAVAAYVRALQLSQHAAPTALEARDVQTLNDLVEGEQRVASPDDQPDEKHPKHGAHEPTDDHGEGH